MASHELTTIPARSLPVALVVAMRPKQWLKNVLVFAAPIAAGALFTSGVLLPTVAAFIAFCLISSATYLVNDARDVTADRMHPTKCARPIAAGQLPVSVAYAAAVILAIAALAISWVVSIALLGIVVAYAVFTIAYSLGLKHEPVVELALLAMGFLLRAIAGGAASDLPISPWFLIVAGFGSLYMAAGKRFSELLRTTDDGSAKRRSLEGYSVSYLRFVWGVSAAVAITAYCLWAFDVGLGAASLPWSEWSVLPFVLAILRYAVDIDKGDAEAPDEVVLHDRVLLFLGVAWLVLFGLGAWGV